MLTRPGALLALIVSLNSCGIVLGYDELEYAAPGGGQGGSGQAGGSGQGGDSGQAGGSGQGGDSGQAGGSEQGGDQGGPGGSGAGGQGVSGASGQAGSGEGGQGGGLAGAAGAADVVCPATGRGPEMKRIPRPDGGWTCIDRTEVTRQQYAAFTKAADKPAQDKGCGWNVSYSDSFCEDDPFICKTCGSNPQTCIDLCDARTFCRWAGKQLCGGFDGQALAPGDFSDPSSSQWMNACSSGGKYQLPYGDEYEQDACVTYNGDSSFCESAQQCQVQPAGSKATCGSPDEAYAGVLDLSGNVYEIEDTCDAQKGPNDSCRVRGGGFQSGPGFQYCDTDDNLSISRGGTYAYIGFRCCAF